MNNEGEFEEIRDLEPYEGQSSTNMYVCQRYCVGADVYGPVERGIGDQMLLLSFDGYGEKTSAKGKGQPVAVEIHEGHPRLLVWGDINCEEFTNSITLASASELCRQPDEDP